MAAAPLAPKARVNPEMAHFDALIWSTSSLESAPL